MRVRSVGAGLAVLALGQCAPGDPGCAPEPPPPVDVWADRAACADANGMSGPMHEVNASPHLYGGAFGLWQLGWELYGGLEYAPTPAAASRAQQVEIASRILADPNAEGPPRHWIC